MTKVDQLIDFLSSQYDKMANSEGRFAIELNQLLDTYDEFAMLYEKQNNSPFNFTTADLKSLNRKSKEICWFNDRKPLIRFTRRMIQESERKYYARTVIENKGVINLKKHKKEILNSIKTSSELDHYFLSYCHATLNIFLKRLEFGEIGEESEAFAKLKTVKEMHELCFPYREVVIGELPKFHTDKRSKYIKKKEIEDKQNNKGEVPLLTPLPPFREEMKLVKHILKTKNYQKHMAAKKVKCCTRTIDNYLTNLKNYHFEDSKLFWIIIERDR